MSGTCDYCGDKSDNLSCGACIRTSDAVSQLLKDLRSADTAARILAAENDKLDWYKDRVEKLEAALRECLAGLNFAQGWIGGKTPGYISEALAKAEEALKP